MFSKILVLRDVLPKKKKKKPKEEILEDAADCVLLLQFPGHTGVMQALRRSAEFPKLPFILGTLALKGRTPSTTWRGNQVQAGEASLQLLTCPHVSWRPLLSGHV